MRKKVFGRQLSRGRKAREALFRSLIKALIINGKIVTTKAKAKAVIGEVDKLINFAKQGSVVAKRKVSANIGNDRQLVNKLYQEILPAFSQRKSGFTRIILLPRRAGDAAEMARLEWVEKPVEKKKEKKEAVETKQKKETAKKTIRK